TLNAEMFIPVYQHGIVIAYIIINRQKNGLYGNHKQDEIIVFARYLKTILHLIQNRNKDNVYDIKEQLDSELQHKTAEMNQYKQNIRSVLRNLKQKDVGLVFYKNKRFIYGNQTAHTLITVNINTHDAHPITQAIKKITTLAASYNAPQKTYVEIDEHKKLILIAVPEPDNQEIVIMVYQLESPDTTQQLTINASATDTDGAWYLEATESGALLNQLIPGTSKETIDFKINLLKVIDSPKGILLTMPKDEITPTIAVLQQITSREKVHTITLTKPTNAIDIAPLIFGINPIFGLTIEQPPLLETLDGTGMLLLQNAEFLDVEVQKLLAHFIAYGTYTTFKSNKTNTSDVRIICSVDQDNNSKYRLSDDLRAQLAQLSISLAPYATERNTQLKTNNFTPATIHTKTYTETRYHPAYCQDNTEIAQIVHLGKAALKDKKSMSILWAYFKDQTTLATALGVNRSSINRRCRQYKLT
ncbi:MAG TPA: hypothetical protein VGT41_03025, partial [Candidatus Babeliales bacterium]|nr:hypothetical protein [Candidatus Babeliales bacterium]